MVSVGVENMKTSTNTLRWIKSDFFLEFFGPWKLEALPKNRKIHENLKGNIQFNGYFKHFIFFYPDFVDKMLYIYTSVCDILP
jgi:hypothetical protein